MEQAQTPQHKHNRTLAGRITRVFLKIMLVIIVLIVAIALLILTPPVQHFIRGKATGWLSEKLNTKVELGRIYIGFPKSVVLEDIYLEDLTKDTLVSAGRIEVDVSMLKLLRSELEISRVELNGITAKVRRELPDTVFNFQFIIDAFNSAEPEPAQTDTSSMKISVRNVELNAIRMVYKDDVTGNDITAQLEHFDTRFDRFDLDRIAFDIPSVRLTGLWATVYQRAPLLGNVSENGQQGTQHPIIPTGAGLPATDVGPATPAMDFNLGTVALDSIWLDYRNTVSALFARLDLGSLRMEADQIDLPNQRVTLDELQLDQTTAAIRIGKKANQVNAAAVSTDAATTGAPPSGAASAENTAGPSGPTAPEVDTAQPGEPAGWQVFVKNIAINNNHYSFVDETANATSAATTRTAAPRLNMVSSGSGSRQSPMDFADLDASAFTLHAHNFFFSPDSISGSITRGEVAEKSGFQLNRLEMDFLYSPREAYLRNLLVETPGTRLQRSVALQYPSLESIQEDIGQLALDLDLEDSRIQVKDILSFVPALGAQPAFANPAATWLIDGRITGKVSALNIQRLQLSALNNTRVDLRGRINGLPNADGVSGNLVLTTLQTSRKDILLLSPEGTIPATITLPESISLRGSASGSMRQASANLQLLTSSGNAAVKGTAGSLTDKLRARYDVTLTTDQLDLGAILQNDSLFGPLTANIRAAGTGFDPSTAAADLEGIIQSATLNRYTYKDIRMEGKLANQQGSFRLAIQDPNIHLALNTTGDLSEEYPAVKLDARIDSIKTQPLHLTTDPLSYRGQITADFRRTDPADPEGELFITESLLTTAEKSYPLDTISLRAGSSDTGRFIALQSAPVKLALTGQFQPTQLAAIFTHAIQPYYNLNDDSQSGSDSAEGDPMRETTAISGADIDTANQRLLPSRSARHSNAAADSLGDYTLYIEGQIVDAPLLQVFLPTLTRLDPIHISGRFTSASPDWNLGLKAPLIIMGTNRIQALEMQAAANGQKIDFLTTLDQFNAGPSLTIYGTEVGAEVADNMVSFGIDLKDQAKKNKYRLAGVFEQPDPGVHTLHLDPDGLLLNYDPWDMAADNLVRLENGDINVRNFLLSRNNQQLGINSRTTEINSPLEIRFDGFRIGTLAAIAKQDSLLADGVIDGQAVISDMATRPSFTSDLTVTDLMLNQDTVGNLALKVGNSTPGTFDALVQLTGKGNDLAIDGAYHTQPENAGSFEMVMDIRKLQMASLEALSFGAIRKGSGFLSGHFDITGTSDAPAVNGNLHFNQTGFTPAMLGSHFTIDQEDIRIDNRTIRFDSFSVLDSAKNELNLDGNIRTDDFLTYTLDLDLTAENFHALSSTKQDNQLFYGQFFFDTDLDIGGTATAPHVQGTLIVNENTNLTIVLPQGDPGVVEREGIVRFVDMDSVRMDTTLLLAYDTALSRSDITGMDISVNIEVNREAEFTLVVDEGNGDFLNIRGAAELNGGIDPSGKTTLAGTYEIEEGAYEVSLNLIKRRFDIKKGGRITWLGEPTRADVDLTAVYIANTAPITLVENQIDVPNLNVYKQKLPFEVNLILKGELMQPEVSFGIELPENNTARVDATVIDNVESRLTQLRSEPSELNKQVFALLLLNRFISENPFASSGDALSAGTVARQSVSKLLSDQLNSLAADLISGVHLDFDLESTEDYTTGKRENRTDLNVSLSKELLNDRLKVTVGSNFELEGPQQARQRQNNLAGNVALDYMLSKDGRYLIRAYRKNEYEGVLDGYIIETGLNFIMTFNYDRLREIFHSPKPKGLKIKKKKNKTEEPAAAPSDSAAIQEQLPNE